MGVQAEKIGWRSPLAPLLTMPLVFLTSMFMQHNLSMCHDHGTHVKWPPLDKLRANALCRLYIPITDWLPCFV